MHYAHVLTTQREKVISGAFASAMHLMFIALLVFGVNWQKKVEPQVNIVDLWSPPSEARRQPVEPPPKPEVKPEVPPKVEPTPPKVVAKPEVAKPDIALKDKEKAKEKEKEKEKEKAKNERRIAEDKQKEAKKREDAAQKAQQAEAQRLANEQAEAQRAAAAQAASAQAKMRSEYIERIRNKIKGFIVRPPNLKGNEEAEFDVVLLPDGNVLRASLKRGSGNAAYDGAVERAINRAQPLPMPPDPVLLRDFRELNLTFNARE